MIDWDDIKESVEEALYVSLEIEDLTDMLVNELDFSEEYAEQIVKNIYNRVEATEDQVLATLTLNIAGYIQDCVRIRDEKLYPEDAPGQLHLFE